MSYTTTMAPFGSIAMLADDEAPRLPSLNGAVSGCGSPLTLPAGLAIAAPPNAETRQSALAAVRTRPDRRPYLMDSSPSAASGQPGRASTERCEPYRG